MLAALAALLFLPGSALAARTYADQVKGIEYSATTTVGKFAGTATGALPGTWQASVVHDPITAAPKAPITGGSFQLYGYRPMDQPPRRWRRDAAQHADDLCEQGDSMCGAGARR